MRFWQRFLDRLRGVSRGGAAALPSGLRVYAVGDIHGYSNLLETLAQAVAADLRRDPPARSLAVFVGDYVDRGPDSAGVIERLVQGRFPTPIVTLRGNHEDMMMRALAPSGDMDHWCDMGGLETIASYGIDIARAARGKGLGKLRKELLERMPEAHRAFLAATRLCFEAGDYFFAHAGARPGVRLDRQAETDLLWIREEFSDSTYDFGKTIVHGHTPHRRPENEPRRINVDTGAFKWGVLTAVVLEGTARRFISTREAGAIRPPA